MRFLFILSIISVLISGCATTKTDAERPDVTKELYPRERI